MATNTWLRVDRLEANHPGVWQFNTHAPTLLVDEEKGPFASKGLSSPERENVTGVYQVEG
jgi:hypothetical protein